MSELPSVILHPSNSKTSPPAELAPSRCSNLFLERLDEASQEWRDVTAFVCDINQREAIGAPRSRKRRAQLTGRLHLEPAATPGFSQRANAANLTTRSVAQTHPLKAAIVFDRFVEVENAVDGLVALLSFP